MKLVLNSSFQITHIKVSDKQTSQKQFHHDPDLNRSWFPQLSSSKRFFCFSFPLLLCVYLQVSFFNVHESYFRTSYFSFSFMLLISFFWNSIFVYSLLKVINVLLFLCIFGQLLIYLIRHVIFSSTFSNNILQNIFSRIIIIFSLFMFWTNYISSIPMVDLLSV